MHNSNVIARGSLEHGKLRLLLKRELVEDFFARVSGLACLGENVLGNCVGEWRIRRVTRHISTRISYIPKHCAISSELEGILNPGVCQGWRDERCTRKSEARGMEEFHSEY
jgi:hypothetical protein